jgi:hypothetical protein
MQGRRPDPTLRLGGHAWDEYARKQLAENLQPGIDSGIKKGQD